MTDLAWLPVSFPSTGAAAEKREVQVVTLAGSEVTNHELEGLPTLATLQLPSCHNTHITLSLLYHYKGFKLGFSN